MLRAEKKPGRRPWLRLESSPLAPFWRQRRSWFVLIVVASVGAGLAEAAVLAVIAHVAASLSSRGSHAAITVGPIAISASIGTLLAAAMLLSVARLLLQLAIAHLPARLSAEVQRQLRLALFDAYLDASWAAKASDREGYLQELMGGHVAQAGAAVLNAASALTAALAFAALVSSALVLSIPVALAVMATAGILFSALRPLSVRVRRLSAATSEALVDQAAQVAEAVRLAQEVEVFGVEDAERGRFGRIVSVVEQRFFRARALSRVTPVIYQSLVLFLLIGGLALLYALDTADIASLGAVVLMLIRASSYGQQFQTAYQTLGESMPYLERVNDAVEQLGRSRVRRGTKRIAAIEELQLEQVSFAYSDAKPALRNLTFTIAAGESLGVVGPSGAGKSTLVQILLRLREPTAGKYRINGLDAATIDAAAFSRLAAYVPQDPGVLAGTVSDNIRLFRDWIDDDAIREAARLAQIHEEILTWPEGYSTIIGQRADAVSGGQRQRLCIARALAGRPQLLMLDEPASALDLHSEQLLGKALHELSGHMTLVVVAHRLSTLNFCDRVLVLREGHVDGLAPPSELYAENAFYRRAVEVTRSTTGAGAFIPLEG